MKRRVFLAASAAALSAIATGGLSRPAARLKPGDRLVYVGTRGPAKAGHRSVWSVVTARRDGTAHIRMVQPGMTAPEGYPPFDPHRITPQQLTKWFSRLG